MGNGNNSLSSDKLINKANAGCTFIIYLILIVRITGGSVMDKGMKSSKTLTPSSQGKTSFGGLGGLGGVLGFMDKNSNQKSLFFECTPISSSPLSSNVRWCGSSWWVWCGQSCQSRVNLLSDLHDWWFGRIDEMESSLQTVWQDYLCQVWNQQTVFE